MSNALDKIKKIASTEKSSWLDEAKERWQNKAWRKYSFQIAARILIEIRRQKPVNGMTQKLLAEKMGVAPQYINKVLKGKENLTLETISKFEKLLDISLINVVKPESTSELKSSISDKEVTFQFVKPVPVYIPQISGSRRKQTEENMKSHIIDGLNEIFEQYKISKIDKTTLLVHFHELIDEFSKNKKQKTVQIKEIENFTSLASEPDEQDWKNYKIAKRSKKSNYENEG